jgi:hypothetical protein
MTQLSEDGGSSGALLPGFWHLHGWWIQPRLRSKVVLGGEHRPTVATWQTSSQTLSSWVMGASSGGEVSSSSMNLRVRAQFSFLLFDSYSI